MRYLVDANVLSEPTKLAPSAKVINWLSANEQDIVVDPFILAELHIGILSLPQGRKRSQLEQWFEEVVGAIVCLPWDANVASRWAVLVVTLKQSGQTLPLLDSMFAASALQHDLVLVTRNTLDFARSGVKVLNPFE
jgi:predicted nucleic acid-binding protein